VRPAFMCDALELFQNTELHLLKKIRIFTPVLISTQGYARLRGLHLYFQTTGEALAFHSLLPALLKHKIIS
jgi:hypothetical protein